MKKYDVGDSAWFAHYDMKKVEKPCHVCFGKKEVNLILGNEEQVKLPCNYCGHGWDEPRGFITEYEYVAEVKSVCITSVQIEANLLGEKRRYYSGFRTFDAEDLFDTREEAIIRCDEKVEHRRIEEETTARYLKFNNHKSYSWNAGYHLQQASHHKKRAEYHEQKAILCKARIKG